MPYLKGFDKLLRITTQNNQIDVTPDHLFFDHKRGWTRAAEIYPGNLLASYQKDRNVDEKRYLETTTNSPLDYPKDNRSCGQQLPQALNNVQSFSPLLNDVHERNHQSFYGGDRGSTLTNNHLRPEFDHLSKNNYVQNELSPVTVELLAQQAYAEWFQSTPGIRDSGLFLDRMPRSQQELESFRRQLLIFSQHSDWPYAPLSFFGQDNHDLYLNPFQLNDCGVFELQQNTQKLNLEAFHQLDNDRGNFQEYFYEVSYINYNTSRRLRSTLLEECVSVELLYDGKPQPFYDLHVPKYNCYQAEGFWNHNSGKTLTGANHVFEYCKNLPNTPENRIVRGALVSETLGDVKMTMIEGATGLRSIVPKSLELKYNRSLGEYSFYLPGPPYREVFLKAYSSQSPDQLRGPQHHIIWLDEPAKCADSDENPENENTTWSNLEFGLRLGTHPHVVVTGTPTPCKLVKFLRDHEDSVVANMSSLENLNNLPDSQRKKFERLNPNSRTYQQEVMAQILEDNPDSQFDQTTINHYRKAPPEVEEYPPNSNEFRPVPRAKVLGWDPSMTSNIESDECGLVLALKTQEHDPLHTQRTYTHTHAYILEDYSGNYSPAEQALKVIDVILEEEVDELVFEQNQGADFIMTLLQTALKGHPRMKDHQYSVKELRKKKTRIGPITRWRITTPIHTFIINGIHAKQGKITRAETASLAYENGDVHHPLFPLLKLEEQMVAWNPLNTKKSPDRLDAVVYTLLHIFGFEGALTAPRHGKLVKPEGKNIGTGVDILTGTIPNKEKPSRYAELYSGDMRSRPTRKQPAFNPQDPERFLRDILQDRGKG